MLFIMCQKKKGEDNIEIVHKWNPLGTSGEILPTKVDLIGISIYNWYIVR